MFLIFIFNAVFAFTQEIITSDSIIKQNYNHEIQINGFTKAVAYAGGEKYDFANLYSEFSLQTKISKSNTYAFADIRFRNGISFGEKYSEFEIKEAFAKFATSKTDISLGNQIVNYGKTDGFSPCNYINAQNYFFLSDESDDQNLSSFLLRIKYRFIKNINADFIVIPVYKASVYRYDLFDLGQNTSFAQTIMPDKTFENTAFSAKINFDFPKISFATSFFHGFNTFYGFSIAEINFENNEPLISYTPKPYLKNSVNFECEIPVKSSIIKIDAAYNITKNYASNTNIPNPDLSYVAAIENYFAGFNTILQYIGKYTFNFNELSSPTLTDPANPLLLLKYAQETIAYETENTNRKIFKQQKITNNALALTISKSFFYQTFNAEITGYYDFGSQEYIINPKIEYKISDNLKLKLGGFYINGPEKSIFSYSNPTLNGVFVSLSANF